MVGRPGRKARFDALLAANGTPGAPAPKRRGRPPKHVVEAAKPAPRPAPQVPPADDGDAGLRFEPELLSPDQFREIQELAFGFAKQIMELPLDPNDKDFVKILRVKQTIAASILTATVRVRSADIRDEDDDGVDKLLAEVRKAATPKDVHTVDTPAAVTAADLFA